MEGGRRITEAYSMYPVTFFHADPHAANLIVMKDGVLGWVDFGMLGWLDEKVWFGQYNMRLALAQQNIQKAYTYFVRTLGPLPDRDLSGFENEIKSHLREWVSTANMPGASIAEKSSGFFFLRIFATVRKEKIPMPMDMVRLYRAILISDIVMLRLYPEIDWVSVLKDFLTEKERRRLIDLTSFICDPTFYSRILETAAVAPDAAYSLSQWLREGLPLLRRDLKTQLTRLDRTWLSLLRMGRNLSGLFVLYMICHRLFKLSSLYTDGWRDTGTWLNDHSIALGLTGFVLVLFWNNLIRSFK
jgi:predicted unusual protein kinase regulating ubiquinone biosynthesis (AarF/ABC1/UbiB family)